MKSIKQLSFIGLSIMLVLTSCKMEKRVYMSGYHIDWKNEQHNSNKQELVSNDNEKQTEQNQIETVEQSENETNTIDNSPTVNDNLTASVDNSVIIIPTRKPVSYSKKENTVTAKTNPTIETKNVISNKKALKSKLKELKANSSSDNDGGSSALRTIGWVFLSLGLPIVLFISIIIGALLMLLGLVFVISGGKKGGSSSQSNTKPDNSNYVDVVYLKNGSAIKGMIIEQTPNVSLKIQTKDGSIFVYKMEEVEKMTKELSK